MAGHGAVMHEAEDDVAVAIEDLAAGGEVKVMTIEGRGVGTFTVVEDIPLGHKIALKGAKAGDTVIKYGVDIGRVVADIGMGEHAHVHNIKTKRW